MKRQNEIVCFIYIGEFLFFVVSLGSLSSPFSTVCYYLCVRDSLLLLAVLKLVVSGSLFDGYLMEVFFLFLNHLLSAFSYLMCCIFIVGFSGLFRYKLLFFAFLIAENRLYKFLLAIVQ